MRKSITALIGFKISLFACFYSTTGAHSQNRLFFRHLDPQVEFLAHNPF